VSNPIPQLYAVRHAAAATPGICYGRTDIVVALDPEDAAAQIMRRLRRKIQVIVSSPSQRCVTPARVLARELSLHLRIDPRLSELDFGVWEKQPWSCLFANDSESFQLWASDTMHQAPPRGETGRELVDRVLSAANTASQKTSLLVTHAGVIRALRALAALPRPVRHPDRIAQLDFKRPVVPLHVERFRW
jgi:alpha-ribazole phosphatase